MGQTVSKVRAHGAVGLAALAPEVREAAEAAARRAGIPLQDWLNRAILSQPEFATAFTGRQQTVQPPYAAPEPQHDPILQAISSIDRRLDSGWSQDLRTPATEARPPMPDSMPPTATSLITAITELSRRLDSAESRTANAVTSIDRAISIIATRMETNDRYRSYADTSLTSATEAFARKADLSSVNAIETNISALAHRVERAERGTQESSGILAQRLERLERGSGDTAAIAQRLERVERNTQESSSALAQAQRALSHVNTQLAQTERHSAVVSNLETNVSAIGARLERVERNSQESSNTLAQTQKTLQQAAAQIANTERAVQSVGFLEANLNTVVQRLDRVERSGEEAAQAMAQAQKALASVTQQINSAESKTNRSIDSLSGSLHGLTAKIDIALKTHGDAVGALEKSVHTVVSRMDTIEQTVRRSMTAAGEAATVESVNALKSRIESLARNVEVAEQDGATIATRIDEKLARLESKITAANAPRQESVADRVNFASIETGIDAIRSKLNSVEKRNSDSASTFEQAVRGLSGRMETVETRYKSEISSLQTTLATLAQHVERALAGGTTPTRSPISSYAHETGAHAVTLPPVQSPIHSATVTPNAYKPAVETTPTPKPTPIEERQPTYHSPLGNDTLDLQEELPPLPPPPIFGPQSEEDGIVLPHAGDETSPQPQRRDEFLAAARRAAQAATSDAPGVIHNYVPAESNIEDPLSAPVKATRKRRLPFVVWIVLAAAALVGVVMLVLSTPYRSGPKPQTDRPAPGTSIGELLESKPATTAKPTPVTPSPSLFPVTPPQATPTLTPPTTTAPTVEKPTASVAPPVTAEKPTTTAPKTPDATVAEKPTTAAKPTTTTEPPVTGPVAALDKPVSEDTLASTQQPGTTTTAPNEDGWIPPQDVGPVSPDIAKLLQSAEAGDARSQFLVGARYAEGNGVTKDERRAAGWFRRAGQQGLAVSQYRLGTMYERGRGVTKNATEAKAWYERAAKLGNRKSMHNLAVMSAEGSSGPADYSRAVTWFKSAAELGLKDSQYNLAILLEKGLGTQQDLVEAYAWYAAAAGQGDGDAKVRMQALEKKLTPVSLASAKKLAAAFKPKPIKREANELPKAG